MYSLPMRAQLVAGHLDVIRRRGATRRRSEGPRLTAGISLDSSHCAHRKLTPLLVPRATNRIDVRRTGARQAKAVTNRRMRHTMPTVGPESDRKPQGKAVIERAAIADKTKPTQPEISFSFAATRTSLWLIGAAETGQASNPLVSPRSAYATSWCAPPALKRSSRQHRTAPG